jgi:glycosyltransferase involved in cell wall biosynthesis
LGIGPLVTWHGRVPHDVALDIMAKGDVFLHSSLLEAASTVVLEALALGLPIICHDACGMSTAVTVECGIKICMRDPETSILGFSRAISQLATDPDLYGRLRAGALARAQELTWDRKVARMGEAYLSGVSAGGQRDVNLVQVGH